MPGNITLEAPSIIANHSRITANAFGGWGQYPHQLRGVSG